MDAAGFLGTSYGQILLSLAIISPFFVPWLIYKLLGKRAATPQKSLDGLLRQFPDHSFTCTHRHDGEMLHVEIEWEGSPFFVHYAFVFLERKDEPKSPDILIVRRERRFWLLSTSILSVSIEESFEAKRFILTPLWMYGKAAKATEIRQSDWDTILEIHATIRKIIVPYVFEVVLRKKPRE